MGETVSMGEAATLLNVPKDFVQQLIKDGVFSTSPDGRLDSAEVLAYRAERTRSVSRPS